MTRLQLTWCVLAGLELLGGLLMEGKSKGEYNMRVIVLEVAVSAGIFYWAGLWNTCQ